MARRRHNTDKAINPSRFGLTLAVSAPYFATAEYRGRIEVGGDRTTRDVALGLGAPFSRTHLWRAKPHPLLSI